MWIKATKESNIKENELLSIELEDFDVVLTKVDGIIYAFEDKCSHDYVKLSNGIIDNQCIKCSKHGSKFDLKTGEALNLPAVAPIQIYKIKIEDGFVYIFEE